MRCFFLMQYVAIVITWPLHDFVLISFPSIKNTPLFLESIKIGYKFFRRSCETKSFYHTFLKRSTQGIAKRCRQSGLTNSVLPPYLSTIAGGGGELRGLSQWVQLFTGAKINFGYLTPYLIYGCTGTGKHRSVMQPLNNRQADFSDLTNHFLVAYKHLEMLEDEADRRGSLLNEILRVPVRELKEQPFHKRLVSRA